MSRKVRRRGTGAAGSSVARISGELQETLKAVHKRYGDRSLVAASTILQPDRISTGVFVMDMSLLGGIPHNRQTMITGKRHAGKSTLVAKIIRSIQMQYPKQTPAYIDAEGTLDEVWLRKLGVDTNNLLVSGAETGEMAVDVTDALLGSKETSLVVIDSVAALAPTREIESSAEDAHVGIHAKLITSLVRKVTSGLVKERARGHYVTVVYVNQWRAQIGGFVAFGEPRTLPGGKALDYATSVHIDIKNKENAGRNDEGVEKMVMNEHAYTILKNKVCGGPRKGEYQMVRDSDYIDGLSDGDIDNAPTMLSYAKKFGYYTGAGKRQTLAFDDVSMAFGNQEACISAIREDKELQAHLWWYLVAHQAQSEGMPSRFVDSLAAMRHYYS